MQYLANLHISIVIFCAIAAITTAAKAQNTTITFKKHILTKEFLADGVAVANVNKDGRIDVLTGNSWFGAPTWQRHEITTGKKYYITDYSYTFLNYTLDINYDGWPDLIRIGPQGYPASWYENPKNKTGHWHEHPIYHSVGNESPAFYDLDQNGIMDLVFADSKKKKMVWLSAPTSQKDTTWQVNIISNDSTRGTHQFTHGLGLTDMNDDGRIDVIIREGWWEAPVDRKQQDWKFHAANFGQPCAQMYFLDLDNDGDKDAITSSAHQYGISWHEQIKQHDTIAWIQHEIYPGLSQTHNLALADINGDGHPDLVTGKRYFAHNGRDPGEFEAAKLIWLEYKPGKKPSWIVHEIDNDSGAGAHLVVQDITGDRLPDVIISNKKGVYVFEQKRN